MDVCRFDAIREAPGNELVHMTCAVDAARCEGCGACVSQCPADAIRFEPVENGAWFISETRFGPMVQARLHPGEDNSGKLVSLVRRQARRIATDAGHELILVDGSPGVGCPVIASLSHAGLALVVAEPTPSGEHDALRVMMLAQQMRIPTVLCVNRWDISPRWTQRLEAEAKTHGVRIVGRVRDDARVVAAQMHNQSIIEHEDADAAQDIRRLWDCLKDVMCEPHPKEATCPS
jgi:MinD superfamily P-loop ATPase